MLGKIKNYLIASGASLLVVLSFIGTVSGTLSWFTYSKQVSFVYHGTSITSNKQLQVGIVTDLDLKNDGFTCDGGIAWALPGAGITSDQLSNYLRSTKQATTSLYPVTTRQYEEGDDLTLYSTPYDFSPDNLTPAESKMYISVPLAFRVINVADGSYAANKEIWVTDASVKGQTAEGFNVSAGLRVHFSNDDTKFILNPSRSDAGETRVCGLLDFNADGFYDFDSDRKEIMYGDFGGTPEFNTFYSDNSELDDVNETGADQAYIFLGQHKKNVYGISNFDDLEIRTQEFESLKTIEPEISAEGNFSGGKPVAVTGEDYVGYSDVSIWVEGWDLDIVDAVSELKFELGLTFEVNKV